MKILKYSIVMIHFYLPLLCFAQSSSTSDEVGGLGKVERIERLEDLINGLQAEVAKLKKGLSPSSSSNGDSLVSTFVKYSDLLAAKTELSLMSTKEIGELKISLNRQARAFDSLESKVNQLKEGELKDMAFKFEALQKSFEALEKSLRETPASN